MSLSPYQRLETLFRRISHIEGAEAVLHWDSAVMMPSGGAATRAGQLSTLAVLRHELLTASENGRLLDEAEGTSGLDAWQAANLRGMRRRWRHATALPGALVETLSQARSASEHTWREARSANDFAMLRPALAKVVALTREAAAAKADAFGCPAYDALLDQYEPGLRQATVDRCFDTLVAELPAMIDGALALQAKRGEALPLPEPVDPLLQAKLARSLVAAVGFEEHHGRLDVSHHPFTGGVPDDVRLTTRYVADDPLSSLMAALHETGHAMYERGLPLAWRHQPAGEAMGMAVHESQSLIIEMQASRSPEFVAYLAARTRADWGTSGPAWHDQNLQRLVRRVHRSWIRVDADELTYPLHVILRYRLEKALLSGDLPVADLPGAWREGMQELLQTTPPDDRRGCLQDIHWPDGAFGYFPTYTLGAMAAAQLMAAAKQSCPDIPDRLGAGDFSPLIAWLQENVHGKGSRPVSLDELLTEATGQPLQTGLFLDHLRARYLAA